MDFRIRYSSCDAYTENTKHPKTKSIRKCKTSENKKHPKTKSIRKYKIYHACLLFHACVLLASCHSKRRLGVRQSPAFIKILEAFIHSQDSMADPSNFSTAVNLLRQATEILSGNTQSSNNTATPTAVPTAASARLGRPIPSSREATAMSEFRNLFSPYSPSTSTSSSVSQNAVRPPKRGNRCAPYYKLKDTWTHEFVCLSNPEQTEVPNKSQKLQLQSAGLGRKKIVFGNKDGAIEVNQKMEAMYPKLKAGGGFEILRSGMGNKLMFVPPTACGYSVPYLRDQAGIGQALPYVHPLQEKLDLAPASVTIEVVSLMFNKL